MSKDNITIQLNHTEAAVVQDALHAYARTHEGPVVDICNEIEQEVATFTGFNYADRERA